MTAGKKPLSSIDDLMADAEKAYGAGALVKASDKFWVPGIERISTGSLAIDLVMGGGVPCGRVTMIYGKESSGKSSLLYSIIAEAQRDGSKAGLVVSESDFDPAYASLLGVNLGALFVAAPESLNEGIDLAEAMIRSDEFSVVGFDSLAAGATAAEIERSAMKDEVASAAKVVNKFMRKVCSGLNAKPHERPNQTAVVMINQLRTGGLGSFYSYDTTPSGRGQKYTASVELDMHWTPSEDISSSEGDFWANMSPDNKPTVAVGRRIKFRVKKNKTFRFGLAGSVVFHTVETDDHGIGFDREEETLRLGIYAGEIERTGSWFIIDGEKVQGIQTAIDRLRNTPRITEQLREKIREKILVSEKMGAEDETVPESEE
jgi:recombination protein RecA